MSGNCLEVTLTYPFKPATRKENARVTYVLRARPCGLTANLKSHDARRKIMCMPILFCGPLRVVCGVKSRTCSVVSIACPKCECIAIWLIFDLRQHAEARTTGCKASLLL